MDISSLKYFLAVAELEHMNQAAQKLHITQPSLSASIRRLEAEIGYSLFDRTGRGIQLNEYGRIFLRGVSEAERIMEECMSEMKDLKETSVNFIRLACSGSPNNAKLIDRLLETGANLQVLPVPADWEQDLLMKNCDLVITVGVLHSAHISQALLAEQDLVFVAGKSHPLAKIKGLSLRDLQKYPFCSTDTSFSLLRTMAERHPELDFHPRIAFLGRNSADLLTAIVSGRYLGLMVQRNLPPTGDFHILDIPDFHLSLPISLYWRQADDNLPALMAVRGRIIDFYRFLPFSITQSKAL